MRPASPLRSCRRWGLFRGRREGRKLLDAPRSLDVASRRSWEASEEDLDSGRVRHRGASSCAAWDCEASQWLECEALGSDAYDAPGPEGIDYDGWWTLWSATTSCEREARSRRTARRSSRQSGAVSGQHVDHPW